MGIPFSPFPDENQSILFYICKYIFIPVAKNGILQHQTPKQEYFNREYFNLNKAQKLVIYLSRIYI